LLNIFTPKHILSRGCSLKKILVHSPKKSQKIPKIRKKTKNPTNPKYPQKWKKFPKNPFKKIHKNPKNPTILGAKYPLLHVTGNAVDVFFFVIGLCFSVEIRKIHENPKKNPKNRKI
jgi:hypothetical protein